MSSLLFDLFTDVFVDPFFDYFLHRLSLGRVLARVVAAVVFALAAYLALSAPEPLSYVGWALLVPVALYALYDTLTASRHVRR